VAGQAAADGAPFGRYRLIELLGRGGMGEVWRAFDTATDRIVALKVLPEHLSQNPEFQQRFRREAHAAAQLNNPHVIPIHSYGDIDGRLYVDMRLIEGRNLEAVLADGPLEPGRAVRIIEQVARALQAAHKVGLVHRDVKPSNVLLDEDDYAYLIDFGIARAVGETSLTATGGFIGSWHYMAPERFSAQEADARADVYALACVLYECLTGHTPYPGDSLEQQYAGHVATPPPRPSRTDPTLSKFDRVTDKGLAKDPGHRYATTVELARDARDATTVPLPRPAAVPTTEQPETVATHAPTSIAPEPQSTWVPTQAAPKLPQHDQLPTRRSPYPPRLPSAAQELPTSKRSSRGTKIALAVCAAVIVAIAAVVAGTVALTRGHNARLPASSTGPPASSTAQTLPSPQVVLPFSSLTYPMGVAVDAVGDVYVTDPQGVFKLPARATAATKLPVNGLDLSSGKGPQYVAVDATGAVYVSETNSNVVLKLPAGATSWTVMTVAGLDTPYGIAVDGSGTLYIAGGFQGQPRVLKVPAGQTNPTVLVVPYAQPSGVAVDTDGNLYVSTTGSGVWKLPAGATDFVSLEREPYFAVNAVAVDTAGNVYFIDVNSNQILKLGPGAPAPTPLPFTGVGDRPRGVAVDTAGNVYVAETSANRVVKLPPT
jgi:serine/threonine protein kinase, bacterial